MENLKLILRLYLKPASAMSDIMDKGSWLFAAGALLVVSIVFFATVNSRLDAAYRITSPSDYYSPKGEDTSNDASVEKANQNQASIAYEEVNAKRSKIPVV